MQTDIQQRVYYWLSPVFDKNTHDKIDHLQKTNPQELEDCFYKNLEFGTGGMRGLMGVGTNRINKYTLGKNTQGIAQYLKKQFKNQKLQVAIAYDCRHNSKELAHVVAQVFSANGIKVFLFEDLRTTPTLSFTVRHLECQCGIVLTASHNPPEYNGYKVYWQDGGQLVPPQDAEIIQEINNLDYAEIQFSGSNDSIEYIGKKIDDAFVEASVKNGSFHTPNGAKDELKIVFTSLHGTSITAVPQTLKQAGYQNVYIVEEQKTPDGDFPTVESPNPEEPEALQMAIQLANKINADIVIGTDPDSDRLGIAVRNLEGELTLLNGNQTMFVMTDFLLNQWKKKGKLLGNEFIGSTIVSTPMMQELANAYNTELKIGLTGFKWIAKMVNDFPELNFIGGGEESYGYMVGDFVRDKDAVTSTLLACEVAAQAKAKGSSFYKKLVQLYVEHGLYKEKLVSLTKKGKEGAREIAQMMKDSRNNPVNEIAGEKVILMEDYLTATARNLKTNEILDIDIPKSNVLIYYTDKGSKIALRPSGTEPKIKFYISVNTQLDNMAEFEIKEQQLEAKINKIINDLNIN